MMSLRCTRAFSDMTLCDGRSVKRPDAVVLDQCGWLALREESRLVGPERVRMPAVKVHCPPPTSKSRIPTEAQRGQM
jgi:hypothetical protein